MPMGEIEVSAFQPQGKSKANLIKEYTLAVSICPLLSKLTLQQKNPCESLVTKKAFRFSRALN